MVDMVDELTDVVDEFIGDTAASRDIVIRVLHRMREPSEEMLETGLRSIRKHGVLNTYTAMIDAALGEEK